MKHIPSNSSLFGFAILEILSSLVHSTLAFSQILHDKGKIPTVYIAGDSLTIGGPVGTDGWGNYLAYSLDSKAILVNNSAIAGESARRYTREGHFAAIIKAVELGDWVIIEFGHNDAGPVYPASQDNGRGDCPGAGDETCPTVYNNVTEIVQTFPTYLKAASRSYLAKGARVIIASPTPNNPWETGNFTWGAGQFAWYACLSVQELGGPEAGVYYVPHGAYAAQALRNLGPVVAVANYPVDHGHTSPYLLV